MSVLTNMYIAPVAKAARMVTMRCKSKKRRIKLNTHMPTMYEVQKSLTSLPAWLISIPNDLVAYSGTHWMKPSWPRM
ncbi:hypothetical protein D3C71_1757010 [compost metagenome]